MPCTPPLSGPHLAALRVGGLLDLAGALLGEGDAEQAQEVCGRGRGGEGRWWVGGWAGGASRGGSNRRTQVQAGRGTADDSTFPQQGNSSLHYVKQTHSRRWSSRPRWPQSASATCAPASAACRWSGPCPMAQSKGTKASRQVFYGRADKRARWRCPEQRRAVPLVPRPPRRHCSELAAEAARPTPPRPPALTWNWVRQLRPCTSSTRSLMLR